MGRRVLVINGHPDPRAERLCAALAHACAEGAHEAGHKVRRLALGEIEVLPIASREAFEHEAPSPTIAACQEAIAWAEHIVLIYPLWLGGAPALVKAFLEQTFRYGFAIPAPGAGFPKGLLGGRSLRSIVTMGMPAFIYRLAFGAFGVRALERGVFGLAGLAPIRRTLVGNVESLSLSRRVNWLARVRRLGALAS